MSKKALIAMVLFSLLLIISSLYVIKTLDPGKKPKPSAEITNIPANSVVVNDQFQLLYGDGKKFTYDNLKNKFSLIYFGFSYCPDVCPTILQKMAKVTSLLSEEQLDRLQFIFVSVDPSRDTPEVLSAYVAQFSDKIQGITGEKEEIDKLVSSLKGYYAKIDNKEDSNNYYVDHSSFIYLLDPQVNLVSQFASSASEEEIANSLKDKVAQE